jgi:adenosylhomocysteine nucleosidase
VHTIMSVGLAGACSAAAAVGSLLEVTEVVDVRTGERFSTAAGSRRITQAGASRERNVVLVTAPAIASAREKARLHASYGADAVDMEAATVARLAEAHGIPFRALKAISDDHTFELEHLGRFATKHGHFHTRAFALHTAVRPHLWRGTMRLGRHSAHALKVLTTALEAEIANAVTE